MTDHFSGLTEAEQERLARLTDPIAAAARILGKRGGSKGGFARAASLSAEQRKEISRKAARARWDKVIDEQMADMEHMESLARERQTTEEPAK